MMILTMTTPEAPTTSANGLEAKPCAQTSSRGGEHDGEHISCLRSNSSSCTSLHSSISNDSDSSCLIRGNPLKTKKHVSFSLQQTAYFSPEQILSKQERKSECWYSESELNISREEARTAIQALHHQLQLDAAAASTATNQNLTQTSQTATPLSDEYGSWVLRSPYDETQIVCLRGIEKYADAAAKYAGQKRLVDSVLQQQSLNNEDIHVALVSRTLSQPFKEVARYYAMKSAEELDLSRKLEDERKETEERKQQEEVATVLLLIMRQQENQQKQHQHQAQSSPSTSSTSSSSKYSEGSPIVTPRGSVWGKRSSCTNSPLLDKRNVKPCIRAVSDR